MSGARCQAVRTDSLRPATIAALDTGVHREIAGLRIETRAGFAASDGKLEGLKAELLRRMFLFWVGSMGTILAVLRL